MNRETNKQKEDEQPKSVKTSFLYSIIIVIIVVLIILFRYYGYSKIKSMLSPLSSINFLVPNKTNIQYTIPVDYQNPLTPTNSLFFDNSNINIPVLNTPLNNLCCTQSVTTDDINSINQYIKEINEENQNIINELKDIRLIISGNPNMELEIASIQKKLTYCNDNIPNMKEDVKGLNDRLNKLNDVILGLQSSMNTLILTLIGILIVLVIPALAYGVHYLRKKIDVTKKRKKRKISINILW